MDSLIAYFDMDGYAGFVWPSYGLTAVAMGGLYVYVRATLRREERALAQLQAAGAGRRRRARPDAPETPGDVPGDGNERAGPDGDERALDEASLANDGGRT